MAEPIISYPGAKWRFYPYMVEDFPTDMEVFIEPFLGGGSVSLSVADDPRFTKLERMIAGDLAPEMLAFWNGVKQNPSIVREVSEKWFNQACPHLWELKGLGFNAEKARLYLPGGEYANFESSDAFSDSAKQEIKEGLALYNVVIDEALKFWNWTQTVDTSSMSLEERAARILLVNKISFSGMGDSGSLSKDRFTDFSFATFDRLEDTSKLLKRIEIYNVSFEETMKYAYDKPEKSFVFLDPPYFKQESSGLYGRGGDTHRGFPHQKFADETRALPCKWFVTYDDSTFVRRMFDGKTNDGKDIYIKAFRIPGGYVMAQRAAEDALAGEEVFIANYRLSGTEEKSSTYVNDDEVDF